MKYELLFFLIIALSGKTKELLSVDNEIEIDSGTELEFPIKENETYKFTIKTENYLYSFTSELGNIFYTCEKEEICEIIPNGTFFKNEDIIFANPYKNLTESTEVKVSPIPIYNELNCFETINENKYFGIKANQRSMLYLDSFDRNSSIYISENFIDTILKDDTKITGKFKTIEANTLYLIKNRIYSKNSISNFKKYFYPLENRNIAIKDDEQNFLYLQNDTEPYILDFTNNTMNKMIKLSSKTLNSTIKISKDGKEEVELNETNLYYKLYNIFQGKLELTVSKNDAFLEFLSEFETSEIKEDSSIINYQMENDSLIIKIPKTQKDFVLKLISNENLQFSLSLGLSDDEFYCYSSNLNEKIDINQKEFELHYSLYKNLKVSENEFISFALNFTKKVNQIIKITYYQISDIDEILDEPIPEKQCKEIISNLIEVLQIYIYNDIAQNPPDIGIPHYHHRRINLTKELNEVNTSNRNFYEFAQDIQKILTTTRDLHFRIYLSQTNKGYLFSSYQAYLPFKFVIKEVDGTHKVFIEKNKYFSKYDNETQEFINSHLNISLKSVNDTEIFEYIQNWSSYFSCKNVHSQFTYIINAMPVFYLKKFPINYYDMNNEYEFEDNQIIKIKYGISKPQDNAKIQALSDEFNKYFLNTIQKYKFTKPPSLEEIEDDFLILKGLKEKLKNVEKRSYIYNY